MLECPLSHFPGGKGRKEPPVTGSTDKRGKRGGGGSFTRVGTPPAQKHPKEDWYCVCIGEADTPGRKRPTASWEHPSLVPQGASGKVGLRLAGAGDISPQAATRIGGAEAARSPPPPPQVVRGGPGGESDLFSLQPAHPHPFQGWDFILRPVPPGLSHLLRRTQNLAEARGDEPFREQGRDGSVPAPSAGRSAGMSVGAPGVSAGWLAPQGGFPVGRKETSRRQEQLQARTPLRRRGGCARGGAARGDGAAADAGPREPRAPAEGRWAPRARSIRGRLPSRLALRFPGAPPPGHKAKERGRAEAESAPSPSLDWPRRPSIRDLFLMEGGVASQSAPDHVCR